MLNIISRSIVSSHTRGPRKVVINLIAGLEELGYPFVVNADLGATKTLWIHDDKDALIAAMGLPPDVAIIAGPNIYTVPSEIPAVIDISRVIWIHPAAWVESFWRESGASNLPSTIWPVGIDTHTFAPCASSKDLMMVYNKQRSHEDVKAVCDALTTKGERYEVITYGQYKESDYQMLLRQSKAIVWVGRSESEGIGLLEALAMGVPALVWDVTRFGDWVGSGHDRFTPEQLDFAPVTAAPYFEERAGLRFTKASELEDALTTFLAKLPTFEPRAYVESQLSLKKQAGAFMSIYQTHFGQSEDILRNTKLVTTKQWKNASLSFRVTTRFKDAVRKIIR